MGRPAREGKSPVIEMVEGPNLYPSTAGNVGSCRNQEGPPSKAKY